MNGKQRAEPFLVLTGPTCVGKTAISLSIAEQINAEIISADSRQVYRSLDIGTAKPNPEELARVRHHFIDEKDLDESYSAGQFAVEAYTRISEILTRGQVPLVVGGSTLYLYALQFGLSEIPDIPKAVRRGIEHRLASEGAQRLYEELKLIDPETAKTLDPTKTQRLVRGLEVFHFTGRSLSSFHTDTILPPYHFRTVVLHRNRAELYDRINRRVELMIERGLIGEVESLLVRGVDLSHNALRTIGYQEPLAYLRGEINFGEMVRLIKRNTRRYAKRQITWFRRFPSFEWVSPVAITDIIARR